MAYHKSIYLFLFLPAVLCTYQLAPQKWRWKVLLGYSYLFFFFISRQLILLFVATTAWTYWIGRMLYGQDRSKKKKRIILSAGILVLLGVLFFLKYSPWSAENINVLLEKTDTAYRIPVITWALPIGISFYTLQAVGYMVDIYWGKVKPEKHPGKLALFLAFFPQIMEGPICSYSDTADSLWEGRPVKEENLRAGCIRILWGLFKKMVVADRMYLLVKTVFDGYEGYGGAAVIAAAIGYTIQLYMEFSGTMDIIIGNGWMFGIRLPENFRQPFCSRSASEFWKRWHITLGAWFRTYIFYPISVSGMLKKWNRYGRKHAGKYMTKLTAYACGLFPVWLCNGLWHGARWSYIFYGMYYFVLILLGIAFEPVHSRLMSLCHIDPSSALLRRLQILKTWCIIFIGELFFRADSLSIGMKMFASIFREFRPEQLWDGTLLTLGLDGNDYAVILAGCVIAAVVGALKERKTDIQEKLQKSCVLVRWGVCYGLIFAVIIFGAYGAGYLQVDLIYAGF